MEKKAKMELVIYEAVESFSIETELNVSRVDVDMVRSLSMSGEGDRSVVHRVSIVVEL